MTSSAPREFDVVLFGATGFVGQLTAKHLADNAPEGTRIALAGRSISKLTAVRASLGDRAADWALVETDASSVPQVEQLAARTTVVATTVGPYARYGVPLAAACARAGTHYADLTGEVLFVRSSIDDNQAAAEASGARIVHSCGFDSIPSDLGVLVTAERARADGEGTLGETTLFVRSMRGGISGGTIDSARQQIADAKADKRAAALLGDSYSLSPDRSAEPPSRNRGPGKPGPLGQLSKVARLASLGRDAESGRWTAPFVMAAHNTRIVRRSNALTGWSYGREFRYQEVTDCGKDLTAPLKAAAMAGGLGAGFAAMSFAPTAKIMDHLLPKPGEGPSAAAAGTGRFVMDIVATTTTGARYRTRFAAEKDPGYGGTAVMFGESALSLALDGAALPDAAGVLTPATAMGDALVERLRAQPGFTIETTRLS